MWYSVLTKYFSICMHDLHMVTFILFGYTFILVEMKEKKLIFLFEGLNNIS